MNELLDEVLEAHGGLQRWQAAQTIHARVRTDGLLLRTRVPGNRFADYNLTVQVREARAVFDPFPRDGEQGVFDAGAARIEGRDGEVLSSRADPRPAFFGRSGLRRNLRWDPLYSVYFAGYAMWNYLTIPYLLTRENVEIFQGPSWQHAGETWRRLDVSFPPGIPTHSPRQSFYFDAVGRLRRHDYVAEVVGRWARAAHLCTDHVHAGGLLFATRRQVRPRGPGNHPLPAPTLVSLRLTDLQVTTE
ncbi:hypothetical protein [Mycobacterium sp.]|uniref:hypothetical protein n=1 Tax=Mycobacterium sp. TaxID=1785 RepID=UPI003BACF66F